jgi:hypothetical protein
MKQTGLFHNDFLIASDLSEREPADADMICFRPITAAKSGLCGSKIEHRSNSNVQVLFSTHVQGLPVLRGVLSSSDRPAIQWLRPFSPLSLRVWVVNGIEVKGTVRPYQPQGRSQGDSYLTVKDKMAVEISQSYLF